MRHINDGDDDVLMLMRDGIKKLLKHIESLC